MKEIRSKGHEAGRLDGSRYGNAAEAGVLGEGLSRKRYAAGGGVLLRRMRPLFDLFSGVVYCAGGAMTLPYGEWVDFGIITIKC